MPCVLGARPFTSAVLYAQRTNMSLNGLCFGCQTFQKCCIVCSGNQYVIERLVFWVPGPSKVLYSMLRYFIFHGMPCVLGARPFRSVGLSVQRTNISWNALCFGRQALQTCYTVCSKSQYVIECLIFWMPDLSKVLYCMLRELIFHGMPLVLGARPFKSVVLSAQRTNISLNAFGFAAETFKKCCTVCSEN